MMKPKYQKMITIALILGGVVAGISSYFHSRQAAAHSETDDTDSSHSPGHLVFPANAPQLAYVKTSQAVISPLPASEPLTAQAGAGRKPYCPYHSCSRRSYSATAR